MQGYKVHHARQRPNSSSAVKTSKVFKKVKLRLCACMPHDLSASLRFKIMLPEEKLLFCLGQATMLLLF